MYQETTPVNTNDTTNENNNNSQKQRPLFRVLTVGDGDLTLSLALQRAFMKCEEDDDEDKDKDNRNNKNQTRLDLTASTLLPNAHELIRTYSKTAPAVLKELDGCRILYGVDATQLHQMQAQQDPYDAILFHHPHLGTMSDDLNRNRECERELAVAHERLLAHYLWSASQCITKTTCGIDGGGGYGGGLVHLCLSGTQETTWKLRESCYRLGLKISSVASTSRPFHVAVFECPEWAVNNPPKHTTTRISSSPQTPPPRQRRRLINGKHHNQYHWLMKYGYQHQRTHGELVRRSQTVVNLQGSKHFIIRRNSTNNTMVFEEWTRRNATESGDGGFLFVCNICLAQFETMDEVQHHLKQPAMPPPPLENSCCGDLSLNDNGGDANDPVNNNNHAVANIDTVNDKTNADAVPRVELTTTMETTSLLRLRRYIQTHFHKTKSQVNDLVHGGYVCIDGIVVMDTARWVPNDATVTIQLRHPCQIQNRHLTNSVSPAGSNPVDAAAILDPARSQPDGMIDQDKCDEDDDHDNSLLSPFSTKVTMPELAFLHGGIQIDIIDQWTLLSTTNDKDNNVTAAMANEDKTTNKLLVVWKPVGLRAVGHFEGAMTLESVVSKQQHLQHNNKALLSVDDDYSYYHCWNRLDTGCSGLCVLAPVTSEESVSFVSSLLLSWTFTFTLMVHGHAPDEWRNQNGHVLKLPLYMVQRWNKRNQKQGDSLVETVHVENVDGAGRISKTFVSSTDETISIEEDDAFEEKDMDTTNNRQSDLVDNGHEYITARIRLLEQTDQDLADVPLLSTLRIETPQTVSGIASLITHVLRTKYELNVVGDRFSRRLDAERLPRPMRNVIKHKLCLALTGIRMDCDDALLCRKITCPTPEKWKALYWQAFLCNKDSIRGDKRCAKQL